MNLIHPKLADELNSLAESLAAEGSLLSRKKLQGFYDTFRREFGPEVLRSLDGQELLERMHAHGGQDSLVYWLEFKDDAEFPAVFGSIAGGSALKFGVYRRKETGTWAVAGPSGNAPKDIGLAEAIEIARRHRDQLLAACDALSSMRPGADDQAYLELQRQLQSVAPDVQDTAWGTSTCR
jgi:5-methylcytosine-specific restriction enzyme B